MSVSCPHCSKPVEGAILKVEADAERDRKVAAAQAATEQATASLRAEAAQYKSAAETVAAELVKEREASASSQRAVRAAQVEAAGLSPEYLPVLEMVYAGLPEKDRPDFKSALAPDGAFRNNPLTKPYFGMVAAPVAPVAPVAVAQPAAQPANGQATVAATATQAQAPDLTSAIADVLRQFGVVPAQSAAQPANGLPRIVPANTPASTSRLTPAQLQEQLAQAKRTMKPEEYKQHLAKLQAEYAAS